MESGNPCTYEDLAGQCCDPTLTFPIAQPLPPKPKGMAIPKEWLYIGGGLLVLLLLGSFAGGRASKVSARSKPVQRTRTTEYFL